MNSSVPESLADGLSKVILSAAPRKLLEVLRHLRVLVSDDELFFDVVPALCLEYHLTYSSLFPLDKKMLLELGLLRSEGSTISSVEDDKTCISLLASQLNHVVTWVNHNWASKEEEEQNVWDELRDAEKRVEVISDYLNLLPWIDFRRCASSTEEVQDEALFDNLNERGEVTVENVFFHSSLLIFVEVDPMEGCCVRVLPFPDVSDPNGSVPEEILSLVSVCSRNLNAASSTIIDHIALSFEKQLRGLLQDPPHWMRQEKSAPPPQRLLPEGWTSDTLPDDGNEKEFFESEVTVIRTCSAGDESQSSFEMEAVIEWENRRTGWTGRWRTKAKLELLRAEPSPLLTLKGDGTEMWVFQQDPIYRSGLHHHTTFPLPVCSQAVEEKGTEEKDWKKITDALLHHFQQHWISARSELRSRLSEAMSFARESMLSRVPVSTSSLLLHLNRER